MRKTIASSAGLLGLLLLGSCGGGPEADPQAVAKGKEIYTFESCASCHGPRREGGPAAPPLDKLRRHWSEQELTRYLGDPLGYPADSRLQHLQQEYPGTMAGIPGADQERLAALVSYLLSR